MATWCRDDEQCPVAWKGQRERLRRPAAARSVPVRGIRESSSSELLASIRSQWTEWWRALQERACGSGDVTAPRWRPSAGPRSDENARDEITLRTEEGERGAALSCIAETEFEPGRATREAFESLAAHRLPSGHLPREEWIKDIDYIDGNGDFDNHVVPLHLMPLGFQSFASQVDAELDQANSRCRKSPAMALADARRPCPFLIARIGMVARRQGLAPLPRMTHVEMSAPTRLEVSLEAADEVQKLLEVGEAEPLAHELFREAWSQRNANPRSSMLVAVTALEVGIKQYISACVPAATWLAENVPTPPVVALLRDYVPTVQPPDGTAIGPPSDEVVKSDQDGSHNPERVGSPRRQRRP